MAKSCSGIAGLLAPITVILAACANAAWAAGAGATAAVGTDDKAAPDITTRFGSRGCHNIVILGVRQRSSGADIYGAVATEVLGRGACSAMRVSS